MSVSRRVLAIQTGAFVTALFAGRAHAIQFTYDATGRLIRVEYDDGSTVDYSYDDAEKE